eukprot:54731-Rhodomonas_salina.1
MLSTGGSGRGCFAPSMCSWAGARWPRSQQPPGTSGSSFSQTRVALTPHGSALPCRPPPSGCFLSRTTRSSRAGGKRASSCLRC